MKGNSAATFKILILAILYIATGYVGLSLAIPPGYATMLWPPSGIALGMLLVYGAGIWPGVFLGSFLLNAIVSGALSYDTGILIDFTKIHVPALIAIGSSLQAICGCILIRHVLGTPIDLKRISDVVKLFIIGGPLTCLIGASIGTSALFLSGAIDSDSLTQTWISWWTGDIFGIVVFLPLVLFFPGKEGPRIRWRGTLLGSLPFMTVVVIIIPLGLTFYLWKITSEKDYQQAEIEFKAIAQDNENALRYRLDSYSHALLGGLSYFQNVPNLTRESWNNYLSVIPLKENYTGINGVGVIYPVPEQNKAEFISEAQKDGAPTFSIHPETHNLPNYVIKYIYPEESNQAAIGLNIAFEKNRREAAELARDTGDPAITKKISLVQDDTQSPGFLLLYPIYDQNVRVRTVEQRRQALLGWIYAPFVAHNFLKGLTREQERYFSLRIYDGSEEKDENIIYASPTDEGHQSSYVVKKKIEIMQQTWLIVWESTKAFEKRTTNAEPFILLVVGLGFTGMFSVFLTIFSIQRVNTLEYLVKERAYILPLMVFIAAFCGSLYLGYIVENREKHYIISLLDESADKISSVISLDTRELILALQRMGRRWGVNNSSEEIWRADAKNYISDFSTLKAIAWVNNDNIIRLITPIEGLEKQIGLSIDDTPEKAKILDQAKAKSTTYISGPTKMLKGYYGVLVYVPVKKEGKQDGFIVSVVSIHQFLQNIFENENIENFDIKVLYKNHTVYETGQIGLSGSNQSSLSLTRNFLFGDNIYSLHLTPRQEYIESISGILSQTITIVGLLISFLLSITTRSILVSKIHAEYLKEARYAAEAANDAKSLFLSTISHEIRTPLNGVLATAELLERTPLDESQKRYLGIIQSTGKILFNLLNEVLDISKIEMHKLELQNRPFDLAKAIHESVDIFKYSAQKKNIELSADIDETLPEYVMGDVNRFDQVLSNIIGNAVKYTEKGHIFVKAVRQPFQDGDGLHIEVQDTGLGIPKAEIATIFDRFTQAHRELKIEGTGLGLSICKSLIHLMGGDIYVRSDEGKGTTFWFDIPLHPTAAPEETDTFLHPSIPDGLIAKDRRILLADDIETNRIVIADMLLSFGCVVDIAENGQHALDMIARHQYDIVFMDCSMPVMTGYDAARKIRELYGHDLPVIAISAHAFAHDIQKCYDAGMNDYVHKPVKLSEIRKALLKWLKVLDVDPDMQENYLLPDSIEQQINMEITIETQQKMTNRIDEDVIKELMPTEPDKKKRFLSMIIRNSDSLYDELRAGFEQNDMEAVQQSAHAFKSVAAQVGGMHLSRLLLSIEQKSDDSSDIVTNNMMKDLAKEYAFFKRYIEELMPPSE